MTQCIGSIRESCLSYLYFSSWNSTKTDGSFFVLFFPCSSFPFPVVFTVLQSQSRPFVGSWTKAFVWNIFTLICFAQKNGVCLVCGQAEWLTGRWHPITNNFFLFLNFFFFIFFFFKSVFSSVADSLVSNLSSEWTLVSGLSQRIWTTLNCNPSADLSASRLNHQLARMFSKNRGFALPYSHPTENGRNSQRSTLLGCMSSTWKRVLDRELSPELSYRFLRGLLGGSLQHSANLVPRGWEQRLFFLSIVNRSK